MNTIWLVVHRFDNPRAYKLFVKSCHVIVSKGDDVASLREVRAVSGLPVETSMERLEILDEEKHAWV
ncbi:putative START-like domain superfamily protein [Dioscorea sansibarensis]